MPHRMRARRQARAAFLRRAVAASAVPVPSDRAFAAWVARWAIGPSMNDRYFAAQRGETLPPDARYSGFDGSVRPGWIPLLDALCAQLYRDGWNGAIDQVKEKRGFLRFYLVYTTGTAWQWRRWDRAVNVAEWRSTRTCQECGGPATTQSPGGWSTTICSVCAARP
jgi:hypothetical protein